VTVDATPVIETRGLTNCYGTRLAVGDLTLRVHRGEVYGFLGLNGTGKTTCPGPRRHPRCFLVG